MTRAEFIEIIERLQNGDRSALENVYNEMYSSLVMVAYRITHNRQDAHDIAGDTILKLVDLLSCCRNKERGDQLSEEEKP